MKIEIQSKPTQDEFKIIEKGKRSFVHPCLAQIDNYDCEIIYNIPFKFFLVDYQRNADGIFERSLLTTNVKEIIETLIEK